MILGVDKLFSELPSLSRVSGGDPGSNQIPGFEYGSFPRERG